jgi:hypothetical protein
MVLSVLWAASWAATAAWRNCVGGPKRRCGTIINTKQAKVAMPPEIVDKVATLKGRAKALSSLLCWGGLPWGNTQMVDCLSTAVHMDQFWCCCWFKVEQMGDCKAHSLFHQPLNISTDWASWLTTIFAQLFNHLVALASYSASA